MYLRGEWTAQWPITVSPQVYKIAKDEREEAKEN